MDLKPPSFSVNWSVPIRVAAGDPGMTLRSNSKVKQRGCGDLGIPKTTMAQAHCLSHRGELWALGRIHRVAASAQAFPLMLPSRERPLELPGRPGHLGDSIVTPYMECANLDVRVEKCIST